MKTEMLKLFKKKLTQFREKFGQTLKEYFWFITIHGIMLTVPLMFLGFISFSLFNLLFSILSLGIIFYYISEELPKLFRNTFYYVRRPK